MKTNIYEETDRTIDTETGEVIKVVSHSIRKVESEPAFVKMYVDDISYFHGLPNICKSLMLELTKLVDYKGMISIPGGVKKAIAISLNVNPNSVTNAITRLVKEKLLCRVDSGLYKLNPLYFAKGCWYEVQKQRIEYIEMTTKYSVLGKETTITTVMKEDDETTTN